MSIKTMAGKVLSEQEIDVISGGCIRIDTISQVEAGGGTGLPFETGRDLVWQLDDIDFVGNCSDIPCC